MALMPRAARPAAGGEAEVAITAASSLSLSSAILRIISAAEGLWRRAGSIRASRGLSARRLARRRAARC